MVVTGKDYTRWQVTNYKYFGRKSEKITIFELDEYAQISNDGNPVEVSTKISDEIYN